MELEIFLAGSTKLNRQRDIIRNEIMIWNANRSLNRQKTNIIFNVYTFENFENSITADGLTGQEAYNEFIRERADIAIFILHGELNDKTKLEFDVAYESMKSKRKAPAILVLSHKYSTSKEIQDIRNKLIKDGKYYNEYDSEDKLKVLIKDNLDKHVSRKINELRIKRIKKYSFFLLSLIFAFFLCLYICDFFGKKQEYQDNINTALIEYTNDPNDLENQNKLLENQIKLLENQIKLIKAINEYEEAGYPKDNEIYLKAKKQLN